MKAGPVLAMVLMVLVGMWLVLQPALSREAYDFEIRIGAVEIFVAEPEPGAYQIVSPERLATERPIDAESLASIERAERAGWDARPGWERMLLGFFNITSWRNFVWVAVGLIGQGAFFGRMFVQWVVSEKTGKSQVPVIFWWFSLMGGVCLFTYFVWRVDVVGVIGQSAGVVIYARNLRLIHKQKRRDARAPAPNPEGPDAAAPAGRG